MDDKLIIAISSRVLFDLSKSNAVFEKKGIDAYAKYQVARENEPLEPGVAFPMIKKLLTLNEKEQRVEVILLSRNSADTGLRIFNSIQHYKLDIVRAAFTNGNAPYRYVSAFNAHLFLSTHSEDVRSALEAGCAAATLILTSGSHDEGAKGGSELRIAFDGDAVLFSDEAETIYQNEGLEAFAKSEQEAAKVPLPGGPFKGFLSALHHIQAQFSGDDCPIRTALITARSAPTHERVIRTLRAWNIRIDEALFLGGLDKSEFLRAFGADIFFDDQKKHCESASAHVATAHVPHGVVNEE